MMQPLNIQHEVSIHAPARGATCLSRSCPGLRWFLSTLPHGERLLISGWDLAQPPVSIHAPARGATSAPMLADLGVSVSIHAPARGATIALAEKLLAEYVSIHAPARGATLNSTA
ncbi:hypothetical protein [Acetobacter pomorum]|uniref:hypothetical protein n=1 Tax=Acetobacter pomorum TaxID=65959 RepID=UPI0038D16296